MKAKPKFEFNNMQSLNKQSIRQRSFIVQEHDNVDKSCCVIPYNTNDNSCNV